MVLVLVGFFFLIPPAHCRFSLFLSSWPLKFFRIYFAHLNHINHQLNRNQIPNEMTVLKCDGSWCWLLLPMKNYIPLPISYYYVRYAMYRHQSDMFAQWKRTYPSLHVWPMINEHRTQESNLMRIVSQLDLCLFSSVTSFRMFMKSKEWSMVTIEVWCQLLCK